MRTFLTRRRFAYGIAALLVFLVLLHVAGGWYASGLIRDQALAVERRHLPDGVRPADAQEVTYRCGLGDCPAWYVPGRSRSWAVLVHGRAASRAEALPGVDAARRAGMHALDISYRNDPGAPADPSGQYGFGATEHPDLAGAVDHARRRGASGVVLFGYSMGGAIVAAYLREAGNSGFVRGVVLDSPALDLGSAVDFRAATRDVPLLGLRLPASVVSVGKWFAAKRFDVDWDALDYAGGAWLRVPALVFHGLDDRLVPPSTSKRLAAANSYVRAVLTPGAGHVRSRAADPAAYDRRLDEFLDRVT